MRGDEKAAVLLSHNLIAGPAPKAPAHPETPEGESLEGTAGAAGEGSEGSIPEEGGDPIAC